MVSAATVVVMALSLIGRSPGGTVPIRFLDTPPRGASRYIEAFVTHDPDVIYLITSSSVFRDAFAARTPDRNPDAFRKIASVIVHEEWHLRHGADEEGAYRAQIITLMSLGAGGAVISSVNKSMNAVLQGRARARKTHLLAEVR
jgi:hypothetical protein